MSLKYFEKTWVASKAQLADLRLKDLVFQDLKPLKNPLLAYTLVSGLYIKYLRAVQNLDQCYDQLAHTQKRMLVQPLLSSAYARLAELKEELKNLCLSEYAYFDGGIIEKKLIVQDIEFIVPGCCPARREPEIQNFVDKINLGQRIYDKPVVIEPQETEENAEEAPEEEDTKKKKRRRQSDSDEDMPIRKKVLTPEELEIQKQKEHMFNTVCIIQTYERARRDRIKFLNAKMDKAIREAANRGKQKELPAIVLKHAALQIQKLWRGHCVRKELKDRELELKYLIGMIQPSWKSTELFDRIRETIQRRRQIREGYYRDYLEEEKKEKIRILQLRQPYILEDIEDEIRGWLHEWYYRTGTFDLFPPEENGGTVLVVTCQTVSPEEYLRIEEEKRLLAEKYALNPAMKAKDDEEKKKLLKKLKDDAKKEKERIKAEIRKRKAEKEKGFKMDPSDALESMDKAIFDYVDVWGADDKPDPTQPKYNIDMISANKISEIHLELRKSVDEIMRLELQMLLDAQLLDVLKSKKKPPQPPKPEKQKKKKEKKVKDPTASRALEDLFQELVDEGIIHQYPKRTLDDLMGDYSYSGPEMNYQLKIPQPSTYDVKELVKNYCLIPLSTPNMPRPKSVCIVGPRQCGKRLLVHAICNTAGAVLFDLSPAVIVDKYPGKKGLKMLIHLVMKLSRILQPSVIYMDGAEKPFYSKIPPTEANNDPKRLKGVLQKEIVKKISKADQVMLISHSNEPWNCAQGPFMKVYERFIMMSRTDYSSLVQIWQKLLLAYHNVDRLFDCSSLAKVTVGYPVPYIMECIQKVLNCKRMIRLSYEPLNGQELLDAILTGGVEPVSDEEFEKYTAWYTRTKLGRVYMEDLLAKRDIKAAEDLVKEKAKAKKKKNQK